MAGLFSSGMIVAGRFASAVFVFAAVAGGERQRDGQHGNGEEQCFLHGLIDEFGARRVDDRRPPAAEILLVGYA